MTISAPFAQVLAAGRSQFNARVVEAKHRYPALDSAAFAAFLESGVDSVVRAVAVAAPDRVAPVVLIAYDIALELVGQALAGPGARSKFLDQVWQELIPRFARLVSEQPIEVLAALTNAALNVDKVPKARTTQWLREMTAMSGRVDSLSRLRAIGQILAWRAGLAHYRAGAIGAADELPEALALAAVGAIANAEWKAVRDKLLSDPWWSPDRKTQDRPAVEIGQFTGLGGVFRQPPELRACEDGFFVKSAERYYFLIADLHGAVLHPATLEEFESVKSWSGPKVPALKGSRLMMKGGEVELDLPIGQIALACNAHTVVVSSRYSYGIRLFPLR
jgi:hypothetical protein